MSRGLELLLIRCALVVGGAWWILVLFVRWPIVLVFPAFALMLVGFTWLRMRFADPRGPTIRQPGYLNVMVALCCIGIAAIAIALALPE